MSVGWGHKIHAWRAIGVSRGRLMTHELPTRRTHRRGKVWITSRKITSGGAVFFFRETRSSKSGVTPGVLTRGDDFARTRRRRASASTSIDHEYDMKREKKRFTIDDDVVSS